MTLRAVLDTNVIVSGLGWDGAPATILDAASDGQVVLVTSAPLLAELRRVLAYPKLAKVIRQAARLADLIASGSDVAMPTRALAVVDDESDNRVLEAAVEGAADYIVSGDADLLDLSSMRLTAGTVSRIELGEGRPEWATVRAIARALDFKLGDLGNQIEAIERSQG